jgi:serine/threonine protein kinase
MSDSDASGRPVRLTVLDIDASRSRPDVDLFLLEARAAAALHHPNIVETLGASFNDGAYASFAEYKSDCESLADVLDRRGWLEITEVLAIAGQLALALDYAHRSGVLHLNLHPENILIGKDDVAFLGGFGLELDPELDWARLRRSQRQRPSYMSPEQSLGLPADHRSDLYSLGIVLFEMLTDRAPFHAEDPDEIKQRQMSQPACSLRLLRPEMPDDMTSAVAKLLEKNPGERFQDASELLAWLGTAAIPEPADAPSVEPEQTQLASFPGPASETIQLCDLPGGASEEIQLPDPLESAVPNQQLIAPSDSLIAEADEVQPGCCIDPEVTSPAAGIELDAPELRDPFDLNTGSDERAGSFDEELDLAEVREDERLDPEEQAVGLPLNLVPARPRQPYEAPSIRVIPPKVERRSTPPPIGSIRSVPALRGIYDNRNQTPFWSRGWFLLAVFVLTALISFVALGVVGRPANQDEETLEGYRPTQTSSDAGSPAMHESSPGKAANVDSSRSPSESADKSAAAARPANQVRSVRSSRTQPRRSRGRSPQRRERERLWLFR